MIRVNVRKSTFMPGDFSLYLSFAYNESIINVIRSYQERSWHKRTKEWEVPLTKLEDILSDFSGYNILIEGEYVDLTPREEVTTVDFDFKTEPFSHQRDSFLYGMNHDRWFLGDEPGLGKTKQVIDIAVKMKQDRDYEHCLIICGVNGLKWTWVSEVHAHSNEGAYILGQRRKKRTGELYIGSNKDKFEDLANLYESEDAIKEYFIITNIESLRSKDVLENLVALVDCGAIPMIAIDEIHAAKSSSSQQGKAMIKLQPEYRIAMTGTPLMNSPLDLYMILRWLGYEKHTFYTFKNYYAVMGGYLGYQVVGYRHLDELEQKLNSIMLRRLREDVLDLPDKIYINEFVEMLPKQSVLYKEIRAEIYMNIDKIEMSPNPLAEMIRLRQVTGYTGILSSEIQCSAKLDRMMEIVEESIENERKVVIFSNWTQITDEVFIRLNNAKYMPQRITGNTKDEDRQIIVNNFQDNDCYKVIIGTVGAMGTGLTLTAGTIVIFLDEPWSKALKGQAEDRVYRIGQNNKVTIYTLMCKDTIDERIHEIVERKGIYSDVIVDGDNSKINKEMIEYLLS